MTTDKSGFQIAGTGPENYERFVGLLMAPFVDAVIQRANLAPGRSVLDVACGTGFVARAAAGLVGPSGRIAGLDINEGMLAVARSRAASAGLKAEWHAASALDMPFADDEFDAVLCQQGIMFFPDLAKGLSEMARVCAPNGRVVASFWAPMESNPYIKAYSEHLSVLLPPGSLATNDAAFRLTLDEVASVLRSAGLENVDAETVQGTVTLPPMAEALPMHLSSLPYGPPFAALDAPTQARFFEDVSLSLNRYQQPDETFIVPVATHLVSGTR